MTISIDDLLNSLQCPDSKGTLENSKETWSRIGRKDKFTELGLEDGELESFLKEWADSNPYNNL